MQKTKFESFVGQEQATNKIKLLASTAKASGTNLPHLLLVGEESSGRTTLARATAELFAGPYEFVSPQEIKSQKDIIQHLTNLTSPGALIVKDVEVMQKPVQKWLGCMLESGTIDVVLGEGVSTRTLNLKLAPATLIFVSSNPHSIPESIRDHLIPIYFSSYTPNEAIKIILLKLNRVRPQLRVGDNIGLDLLHKVVSFSDGSIQRSCAILKKALAITPACITKETLQLVGLRSDDVENKLGGKVEELFKKMSGSDFEGYVADLLRKKGYRVRLTPPSRDHGVDLQVFKSGLMGIVQCKHWEQAVGEPEIRDFFGAMIHYGVHFGFFVTTSCFTSQSREFARSKNIQLIDRDQLINDIDWVL